MCLASSGEILSIEENSTTRQGKVLFGRVLMDVSLLFVPEANIGDSVLVHAGFAIALVRDEGVRGQKKIVHQS